ncbi:carboxymuconolactone decarboxylase family protein [Microvirga tunisiensis]|uniref:Carboxymuconolactone decarboxylase family protein n=1 Tax=Microvirga tunisiensis TaxID=2108360 RepID=A0A5N7MA10_9HYPH|nr:carboxymuconolactone decarboxylase family protein [Microvirga tunisiensis]MPR05532.1 carboxymuconolactone decarboxylase family protein [Microvirga tunisiensis]MPR23732.1 carboxymuconolactone decarboxylase family protein [Microvirga tunisiensis]
MKLLVATFVSLALAAPALAQGSAPMSTPLQNASALSVADIGSVSPALGRYAKEDVADGLWQRPQLSRRDRSLVTVAILIARNQTLDLPHYINLALDSGVTPRELSETITHLAFYAGWSNAMAAVAVTKDIFAQRRIEPDQLPTASPQLLPLNEQAEATRVASVQRLLGTAAPGLDQYTTDPLFKDVWLRPDLSPRDRSLVTITSLMANGQVAQLAGHLNRALDNGLTQEQAGEVVTQIAFYAGWPNAFSAGPVVAEVLKARSN